MWTLECYFRTRVVFFLVGVRNIENTWQLHSWYNISFMLSISELHSTHTEPSSWNKTAVCSSDVWSLTDYKYSSTLCETISQKIHVRETKFCFLLRYQVWVFREDVSHINRLFVSIIRAYENSFSVTSSAFVWMFMHTGILLKVCFVLKKCILYIQCWEAK